MDRHNSDATMVFLQNLLPLEPDYAPRVVTAAKDSGIEASLPVDLESVPKHHDSISDLAVVLPRSQIGVSIDSGLIDRQRVFCFYDRVYRKTASHSSGGKNGKTHNGEEKG